MLSAWQFAIAVVVLREKLTALEESNDALAKRIQRLREVIVALSSHESERMRDTNA